MPNITYIQPIAQPTGLFRLLDWLENNFLDTEYEHFRCLVAFAKIKPFYKLHTSIQKWNSRETTSELVVGIDHKGTSYQALQYTLANFDRVQILHMDYSTFHPKLYIFQGKSKATIYYGSSNFTSGGLETNFEGGIIIDYEFPQDQVAFDEMYQCYTSIADTELPCTTQLTAASLALLKQQNLLLDETVKQNSTNTNTTKETNRTPDSTTPAENAISALFNKINVKPARGIPKSIMTEAAKSAGIILTPTPKKKTTKKTKTTQSTTITPQPPVVIPLIVDKFVIQIKPQTNGEIYLSKRGVDQNPAFFGVPFTGKTDPKISGNTICPHREPDPIVNIHVFNSNGDLVNSVLNYNLNFMFYEPRKEYRITMTASFLTGLKFDQNTDDYPILVMSASTSEGCDYDMNFYAKGSQVYNDYLEVCDQILPTGGKKLSSGQKAAPRKMGWI